jgi:purine-nucleoside phosphorylase
MLIQDHINLTGENPLIGPNHGAWGPRFPDMSCVYDADLRRLALRVAGDMGLFLQQGVYAGLKGPSFETPAEIRFLKTIGAQAVGMSTVMEVIAARHGGMRVLGLSTITNINDPDRPEAATLEAVVEEADKASLRLEAFLTALIGRM